MRRTLLGLALLAAGAATPGVALAGKCDALAQAPKTAKGDALVEAYGEMLKCSKDEAEMAYDDFMRAAGEVGSIVRIAVEAIDAQAYTPVWNMMEKVPDYEARDEIAKGVGAACVEHPEVLPFLKGAYLGLRDLQFSQWDDALVSCESDNLLAWLKQVVEKPPASAYNEKYNSMLRAFVKRMKQRGMGTLKNAAIIAAGNNGPFNTILEAMDQAVQPDELGAEITDEDRKLLEGMLVEVASGAGPEKAELVADRLFNAGAEAAAASLLPKVYPDRVQAGGRMMYGVASVEACEGEAIIHWAQATDPAKRWSIFKDLEKPARSFKARLKCQPEGPWPVVATPEPVKDAAGIATWLEEVTQQWAAKDLKIRHREENAIALQ